MDGLILEFDKALRSVFLPMHSSHPGPGYDIPEAALSEGDRQVAVALMRVNHCGEICAQALYQGQALVSRHESIRLALRKAAEDESHHLAWTDRRLTELGGRKSLLNPFWYVASLSVGILAGKLGDEWNLGFLAETERQVEAHLDEHLQRLPEQDRKSCAVIEQMRTDEMCHARLAELLGARELPGPVKMAMRLAAGLMTHTAYWV